MSRARELSQCFLRCPFCGSGEQRILRDALGFSIHCDNDSCGVRTPSCGTLEIAASFWNRRREVPDEIEDCKGVPGMEIGHLMMRYGACARCGMKRAEVAAQRAVALRSRGGHA